MNQTYLIYYVTAMDSCAKLPMLQYSTAASVSLAYLMCFEFSALIIIICRCVLLTVNKR